MTYQEKKIKKEKDRLMMEECIKDTLEEMNKSKQIKDVEGE